jgi:hypothetical protein
MPSHEELTAAFDAALTGGEPDAFVAALAPGAVVWHNHDHNEVDARENMAGIAMRGQMVDDLENEHVLFAPTDDGFVLAYATRCKVRSSGNPFEMQNCLIAHDHDG